MAKILAGISYPFRKEGKGVPKEAKGGDVVKSDLIALLKKRKRTSVMNPTLGVGLMDLIFENMGPVLRAKITRDIAMNVAQFMPHVQIIDILISEDESLRLVSVEVIYSYQGVIDSTGALEFER